MIQEGLGEPWPDEVLQAVKSFRQGHLIRRPPLFYTSHLGYPIWALSRVIAAENVVPSGEEPASDMLVELDPDQRPPFGILTSQDCDITEEDRDPTQPWVQVAPVYRCDEASRLLTRDFIVRLNPPTLDDEVWIADLRLEMSIEKGMLVAREPIESFPEEEDYYRLSDLLARRRGRPALASVFNDIINATAREVKQQSTAWRSKTRRVRETIYKLKLAIEEGTRLQPVACKLYVVARDRPTEEAQEWFGEWWDRARTVAAEQGLELLPIGWMEMSQVDVELYDQLIELRNPLEH